MHEPEFIRLFRKELADSLPGEESHLKMSPVDRPLSSMALRSAESYRESAVAVVIFERDGIVECILTQRPEYDGSHGGQVSFPGGKKDPEDPDLEVTARRECFEEIGITPDRGILLGVLTDVYIPVSKFLVRPYVYFHAELPELKKNEREVAEILTFPLFDLKEEALIRSMELKLPNGTIYRKVPYFALANKKVWGATALILSEVRDLLLRLDQGQ